MTGLVLNGTSGDDTLTGSSDGDTLTGLAGDDVLSGGAGADIYVYASGDGSDFIADIDIAAYTDVLKFTDLNPGDITLVRGVSPNPDHLLITVESTTHVITVGNQFSAGQNGLEQIQFADGTVWTRAQIAYLTSTGATLAPGAALVGGPGADSLTGTNQAEFLFGDDANDTLVAGDGDDKLYGGAGNDAMQGQVGLDTLYGEAGDDTHTGGTGNDLLSDGAGADVYVYASGDGSDFIADIDLAASTDVLKFTDLNPGDITLVRGVSPNPDHLLITIDATTHVITIGNQFTSGQNHGVEQIQFANGAVWTRAQIAYLTSSGATLLPGAPVVGGAGADSLAGTSQAEFLAGDAASDTVAAGDGNDIVYGGADNDLMQGEGGADSLYGEAGDDTHTGGAGNDLLSDGAGADVYVYSSGDGVDFIADIDIAASTDVLKFTDLNPGDITLVRGVSPNPDHLLVTVKSTTHVVTIANQFTSGQNYGVEQMQFANGTIWTRAQISYLTSTGATLAPGAPIVGGAGNDTLTGTNQAEFLFGDAASDTLVAGDGNDVLYGGAGNDAMQGQVGADTLYGEAGDDTHTGGTGNDLLSDGAGADVYVYNSGDGVDSIADIDFAASTDVLKFTDLNPGDITLVRGVSPNPDHLLVTVKSTTHVITIANQFTSGQNYGVEQMQFANGTIWTRAQIAYLTSTGATLAPGAPIVGNSGANSLVGTNQAEHIFGDPGNDTLAGGDGNDILYGGTGNDLMQGQVGVDTLYGEAGDDTHTGGTGNDLLSDGAGADVYVYASGDGADFIGDIDFAASVDVLKFTDLNPGDVTLVRAPSPNADHLLVTVEATGHAITIAYQLTANQNYGVEQIQFADGTIWTRAQIAYLTSTGATLQPGAPVLGGSGDDSLTGTGQAEYLFGEAGHDTFAAGDGADIVYGANGDDVMQGGGGGDTLYGEAGADTHTGGTGDDLLSDGTGPDLYVYASGDGSDFIADIGSLASTDILKFTDLDPDDVTFAAGSGANSTYMLITVTATGHVITIGHQLMAGQGFGVEQIQFADGSIWYRGDPLEGWL